MTLSVDVFGARLAKSSFVVAISDFLFFCRSRRYMLDGDIRRYMLDDRLLIPSLFPLALSSKIARCSFHTLPPSLEAIPIHS